MSETENKSVKPVAEESVDDILAGILNPDGSFNDKFNGLLKKYVGGEAAENPFPVKTDISDRRDEQPVSRVEYEAPRDISFAGHTDVDERIEEKIPAALRASYYEAAAEAQRPGFTSTGDVRYPAMGVGAAEERVIFDADWEETAKKEAQRLERVRQDRMLRGDSAYARSYATMSSYNRNSVYMPPEAPASAYIDPLSRDTDFESATLDSQYYSSTKKSFFPEGFSVTQRNNYASGGKTEKSRSARSMYSDMPSRADSDWLKVEEKPQKRKMGLFGRKKTAPVREGIHPSVDEAIERLERQLNEKEAPAVEESAHVRVNPFDGEDILAAQKEAQGLRSTVAEIVDKYNKRSEEDERRRLEEEARLEDERREAELRERRRLEEIRLLKENMSLEFAKGVEEAEAHTDFDEYEDFSTEPREEKKEEPVQKVYGVVFNPAAFDEDDSDGALFTEKLSDDGQK